MHKQEKLLTLLLLISEKEVWLTIYQESSEHKVKSTGGGGGLH
jgi:hypothetical protein